MNPRMLTAAEIRIFIDGIEVSDGRRLTAAAAAIEAEFEAAAPLPSPNVQLLRRIPGALRAGTVEI